MRVLIGNLLPETMFALPQPEIFIWYEIRGTKRMLWPIDSTVELKRSDTYTILSVENLMAGRSAHLTSLVSRTGKLMFVRISEFNLNNGDVEILAES